MLVHFPRIVTDGLVLCLDAGNPLSYPSLGPELITDTNLLVAGDGSYRTIIRTSTENIGLQDFGSPIEFGKTYQVNWNILNLRLSNSGAQIRRGGAFLSNSPNLALAPGFYTSTLTNSVSAGLMTIFGDNNNGVDFDLDYLSVREMSTTINDLAGNNTNASLINKTVFNSNNKGILDFTQSFTQTSAGNHISTTPGQVYYQYNTELTACCWFKRNGTIAGGSGGGQSTANVDNWSTDPAGNVWLFHGNPNNTMSFYVNAVNNGSYYRAITSSILADNTWYFICGSCNSTNIKIYVNGILYGTGAGITSGNIVNNSNSVVQYGKDPRYATNRFFNGYVGQNLLYDRELTANEILQNFNATKGRYGL